MADVTMTESGSQGIFEGNLFTIIPNDIPDSRLLELKDCISVARGRIVPFDPSVGRIDRHQLSQLSYIVSETSDFPDYYTALDQMIHVVRPSWVDASLLAGKAKNPRAYNPDPDLFMNEAVVCCGEIPTGDKEAIEGGVLATGGQIAPTLSKTVTHLIALDLSDPRCQLAISKRLQLTIVLPHWFDHCLKVGRRISERPYTLPDPEILGYEDGPIPQPRTSQQIRDATTPNPTSDPARLPPPDPVREAPRPIKAFHGKNVMLGEDLNINSRLRGVIGGMIEAGRGNVTTKIKDADIYVCNYRDGPDYIKASQDGKHVGNLGWLYYLITHDKWTNPMQRMLHYPRPRDGIPGFENFKISISSYTGEARIYLENLIRASGAEFTKTFKQDNTHLITAHKNSEKCEAAAEWGVDVVNHLWLEASYAQCKLMPLSDNRYNFFPPRTNLGEVLGQTEMDRAAIEKIFFSKNRKPIKPTKQEPLSTVAATSPLHKVRNPEPSTTPIAVKGKRTKPTAAAQTPLPAKVADGKENKTPGSRGAKEKALSKIHNAAPDIAQYEKEMKRRGGVVHGGRRRAEDEIEDKAKSSKGRESFASKRSIEEVSEEEETEDESPEAPAKTKRAKKDKLTPIKLRMLVSKDNRWDNNDEKASKDKARLRELGLFITDDWKKIDIVCAPTAVRTRKFVAALACGPELVSTSYLDFALKHNKLPPPSKHILDASEFEEEKGFQFADALRRAKQNKHRLLRDWTIFCSEKVPGGWDTYRDIIEANGGKCSLWKGRTTTVTASKRQLDAADATVSQNQEEDEGDVLYLISHPDKREAANWTKFRELAKMHDMEPRIVSTDWLLFVAMAQYVHWDPEWELSEALVNGKK